MYKQLKRWINLIALKLKLLSDKIIQKNQRQIFTTHKIKDWYLNL